MFFQVDTGQQIASLEGHSVARQQVMFIFFIFRWKHHLNHAETMKNDGILYIYTYSSMVVYG